jgi:hypothetical protein
MTCTINGKDITILHSVIREWDEGVAKRRRITKACHKGQARNKSPNSGIMCGI